MNTKGTAEYLWLRPVRCPALKVTSLGTKRGVEGTTSRNRSPSKTRSMANKVWICEYARTEGSFPYRSATSSSNAKHRHFLTGQGKDTMVLQLLHARVCWGNLGQYYGPTLSLSPGPMVKGGPEKNSAGLWHYPHSLASIWALWVKECEVGRKVWAIVPVQNAHGHRDRSPASGQAPHQNSREEHPSSCCRYLAAPVTSTTLWAHTAVRTGCKCWKKSSVIPATASSYEMSGVLPLSSQRTCLQVFYHYQFCQYQRHLLEQSSHQQFLMLMSSPKRPPLPL
jgi:hypothetical protein